MRDHRGLIDWLSTLVLDRAAFMKRRFIQPRGGIAASISGSIRRLQFIAFVPMPLIGQVRIPLSLGMLRAGLVPVVLAPVVLFVGISRHRIPAASKKSRT